MRPAARKEVKKVEPKAEEKEEPPVETGDLLDLGGTAETSADATKTTEPNQVETIDLLGDLLGGPSQPAEETKESTSA